MNSLLRTLLLAGVLAIAGWWTWFLRGKLGEGERRLAESHAEIEELSERVSQRDGQIRQLGATVRARDETIEEQAEGIRERDERIDTLDTALRLMKVDRRVAEIEVLSQGASTTDPERVRTVVRFVELDEDGKPLGPGIEATVEGRTVYVETLVVKFEDDYVEAGDELRGTSLCLFQRLFGENQSPSEGVPLDGAGVQPPIYTGDHPEDAFHRKLWERFWDYANDPELARSRGVRAIHGEAPFIELRPGNRYRVELRASGGLTIRPLE